VSGITLVISVSAAARIAGVLSVKHSTNGLQHSLRASGTTNLIDSVFLLIQPNISVLSSGLS